MELSHLVPLLLSNINHGWKLPVVDADAIYPVGAVLDDKVGKFVIIVLIVSKLIFPENVVEFAIEIWFWVLVSTFDILVSISKLLLKNATKTSIVPNEVDPNPPELVSNTGTDI